MAVRMRVPSHYYAITCDECSMDLQFKRADVGYCRYIKKTFYITCPNCEEKVEVMPTSVGHPMAHEEVHVYLNAHYKRIAKEDLFIEPEVFNVVVFD